MLGHWLVTAGRSHSGIQVSGSGPSLVTAVRGSFLHTQVFLGAADAEGPLHSPRVCVLPSLSFTFLDSKDHLCCVEECVYIELQCHVMCVLHVVLCVKLICMWT